MNYGTVSATNFTAIGIMIAWGIILPVTSAIVWKLKTKAKLLPLLVGAIIFPVFALGLETIPKYFLMVKESAVSSYIMMHLWSFALVGAGLAGIFEETGRFVAYKFFLKKHTDKKTAVTYGIGHGGIEAIIILSYAGFQYLIYAVLINQGMFGTVVDQVRMAAPDQVGQIEAVATAITSMTIATALLGCMERLFAMIFHVALSVLVFEAVREKGKWYFFPIAIVLHGLLDVFAACYQFGVITNVFVVEACINVLSIVVGIIALNIYRKMKVE